MLVATKYMNPKDTWQTRMEELPFPLKTCKDDMINSIKIILEEPDGLSDPFIKEIEFDMNAAPVPPTPKVKPIPLRVVQREAELM